MVMMKKYGNHMITKYRLMVMVFIMVFYGVGIMGFSLPQTHALFLQLIPWALLLTFALLIPFHESGVTKKMVLAFGVIYWVSFTIEAIGVHTGAVFGNYIYGNGLGVKVLDTPLMIGVNWLFLVYATAAVTDRLKGNDLLKVVVASCGMLVYDVVLEQMAPLLDMWYWRGGEIPLQNFVTWFVLALSFHALLKIVRIKIENRLAPIVFFGQFCFFCLLMVIYKLSV